MSGCETHPVACRHRFRDRAQPAHRGSQVGVDGVFRAEAASAKQNGRRGETLTPPFTWRGARGGGSR